MAFLPIACCGCISPVECRFTRTCPALDDMLFRSYTNDTWTEEERRENWGWVRDIPYDEYIKTKEERA